MVLQVMAEPAHLLLRPHHDVELVGVALELARHEGALLQFDVRSRKLIADIEHDQIQTDDPGAKCRADRSALLLKGDQHEHHDHTDERQENQEIPML